MEASVMHGLQQCNKALSEIHKIMSIENVEKLMSKTEEAIPFRSESTSQ
jgi:Snf7